MKTCRHFKRLRLDYEREIGYRTAHSQRYAGTPAAKASAIAAKSTAALMARALSGHVSRCIECG